MYAHSNQGTYAATPAISQGFPEQLVPIVEARKKTQPLLSPDSAPWPIANLLPMAANGVTYKGTEKYGRRPGTAQITVIAPNNKNVSHWFQTTGITSPRLLSRRSWVRSPPPLPNIFLIFLQLTKP